jgi:hypothetical protein
MAEHRGLVAGLVGVDREERSHIIEGRRLIAPIGEVLVVPV